MNIIARYLEKYIGTYRVVAEFDRNTNDYPRNKQGLIDPSYDDIYIVCQKGAKISHYGRNVLSAYIPSIGRGKNVIKDFYTIKTGKSLEAFTNNNNIVNFDKLEEEMTKLKLIKDLNILDEEVDFKFYDKDIKIIAELMKAKTSGASIRPFSVKNLPKRKYQIPYEKLTVYKAVTKDLEQSDIIRLGKLTSQFIVKIIAKKAKVFDIKADMKLKMLKGKDYIYDMGYFDEYIKYLKKNLNK